MNSKNNHLVYKIFFNDGFYYIGVTNNLKRRLIEHKRTKHNHAIVDIIILCNGLSESEAYAKELHYVTCDLLADPFCLNKTIGGRHPDNKMVNKKHSLSTKLKMSAIKKQQARDGTLSSQQESHRERMRELWLGDNNPAKRLDVRQKMSMSKRGVKNPRFGKPGTMLNKTLTAEQRQKISYMIKTPAGIFGSSVQAAVHHYCTQQTVINRCKSKKYIDWIILQKGQKYS